MNQLVAVPFNELALSNQNVRTIAAGEQADRELKSLILELGVLQNLIVHPPIDGIRAVVAGGRRFNAVKQLVSEGQLKDDYLMPIKEVPLESDTIAISLAENVARAAMHPADEYQAFALMQGKGSSIKEISDTFSVSKAIVKQRLALGNAPKILLDAYRDGEMTLECLMAFTVCVDDDRKLACYDALKTNPMRHWQIKEWLLGEAISSENGLGKFIGQADYVKAGGAISHDLFAEKCYFEDVNLVEQLASEKLQAVANDIRKNESWSWVKTYRDGDTLDRFVQIQPVPTDVPKSLSDEIEVLEKTVAALDTQCREIDCPADIEKELDDSEEKLSGLNEAVDEFYVEFTAEQKSYSGCLVTVNWRDDLIVQHGIVWATDVPCESGLGSDDGTVSTENSPIVKEVSEALKNDLSQYRQLATQAALLDDSNTANDILYFSLCSKILRPIGVYWGVIPP